jgi:LacI family transcriptional regulator
MKNRVTAKDVAKLAGVSQSTVSRVLNNTGTDFISEKTKERVRTAVNELDYAPNPYARALRGKKMYMLGLIVREIADPFFSKLISEISQQANVLGYRVVLGPAHSDPVEAHKLISTFSQQHDGIIIIGDLRNDEETIKKIIEDYPGFVAMCRGSKMQEVSSVNVDNKKGITLLLNHLADLGHKKFGFLDGGWLGDNLDRKMAFIEYLRRENLTDEPDWIQIAGSSAETSYVAMNKILQLSSRPTAILAADDVLALGAMKAITESGMKMPDDISITGFDDIDLVNFVTPALTTVRQPVEEMSALALELLMDIIEGGSPPNRIFLSEPELIVRSSTGPAPMK